ncbi:hypothetical protein GF342_05005, partial [Candidatus Woesearchaeota archaeon]|nr:hypothetical protein [Candidatus Woesearchaeota archaeon]
MRRTRLLRIGLALRSKNRTRNVAPLQTAACFVLVPKADEYRTRFVGPPGVAGSPLLDRCELLCEGYIPGPVVAVGAVVVDGKIKSDGEYSQVTMGFCETAREFQFGRRPYDRFMHDFHEAATRYGLPNEHGMYRAVAVLIDRRLRTFIGHAGDCRAYLVRDEKVMLLTRDHTDERRSLEQHVDLEDPRVFDHFDEGESGIYRAFSDK